MDVNQQLRDLLLQALALVPATPAITTPAALDTAIAAALPGATLILAKSLVYPTRLTLTKSLTLQSETYRGQGMMSWGMTREEPAPRFLQGITATGDGHRLLGLDLRSTDTIGVMGGSGAIWDRCRLLGDPTIGAHRGIEWRGDHGRILNCFIDDVFRIGQDTQAIGAWDCGPSLVIDNCWLSAAGQSVMFGGADPANADRIPRDITISNCTLTKNPAWIGTQQVKCAIEFKDCINVWVENCRLSYAGISQGQGSYLIVATVRNQDGTAPFSTVRNVNIINCFGGKAAGIVNILGTDNNFPSDTLNELTIADCAFREIDGSLGHGRLFTFAAGPRNVTIRNVSVTGINLAALGYFSGAPPVGLVLGGLTLPPSSFGWHIDNDGEGHAALQAFAPDAVLDATIV